MTTPTTPIDQDRTCRRGARRERVAITPRADTASAVRDPATAELLAALSENRYRGFLTEITHPESRHSLSAGYTEAQRTVEGHLRDSGYTVTTMPVPVGDGLCHNVIGELPGTAANAGIVVICAHLDSVNHQDGPTGPAPGADDNASGSAGAVELAAVLGTRAWANDLRVILFGGEEQGLLGSVAYVSALTAAERDRVVGVINMDMIGRRNGPTAGVLIEGAEVSRELIEALVVAGATWTPLAVSTSLQPFASDHVPFIDAGLPAILTIEADDSANTAVHTAADTVDLLDTGLALDILRMNLAVLSDLLEVTPAG